MKWSLIIPIAFIASIVMFGCTSEEDATSYEPTPGDAVVEGEEGWEGAEAVGSETMEPL